LGGIVVIRKKVLRKRWLKAIFLYGVPFVILAFVQLPLFLLQKRELPFVFGWMKNDENVVWFWFKNTGMFIPLALLGLWRGKIAIHLKLAGIAAWSLFILPNLFQFARWGYDNLKIFTYWYLISAFFAVVALVLIWRIRFVGPIVAVLLFISLTLSGVVEVSRILDTKRVQIGLWSREDQEFAQAVKTQTEPTAVFLTAAIHDHPVASLAGRKIVIGYPGNSWSWGLDGWSERETDVHAMFRGDRLPELVIKYTISYIVVGDRERWFEPKLNEAAIAQQAELVLEQGSTKVYKVR
jgi:hypothetical protein